MNDTPESNQNTMEETQPAMEEPTGRKTEGNKAIKKTLQSVSYITKKVAQFATDMSKTKWFAVLAIVIIGLVLAKLCCDGYHPKNSSGPIKIKTYDGRTLLEVDENDNVTYSIEQEKEINE